MTDLIIMPDQEWYKVTLSKLLTTAIPTSQIARETPLSHRWLNKFMNGELPNASVNRVNTLYNYLEGNEK